MIEKPIALVTGANRGIGYEVARQLAARGCTVWLGSRDEASGKDAVAALCADGADVRLQVLDVTSSPSVAAAVENIEKVSGRLDILVNNAGIALDSGIPPSRVSLDIVINTFQVNVVGCIRVFQMFLPLLQRAASANVVMVSSDIGSQTHQTNPDWSYYKLNAMGYITSKTALNAVTIALAKEFQGSSIKINAGSPGFTATDLNDFRGTNTVAEGAAPLVTLATLGPDGPHGSFLGPDGPEPW